MSLPQVVKVETTFEEYGQAVDFAAKIIAEKLVVDGQVTKIFSQYEFEGKPYQKVEYLLTMKTKQELMLSCEVFIKNNHPYKVPQIIFTPFTASVEYLNWICDYVIDLE